MSTRRFRLTVFVDIEDDGSAEEFAALAVTTLDEETRKWPQTQPRHIKAVLGTIVQELK